MPSQTHRKFGHIPVRMHSVHFFRVKHPPTRVPPARASNNTMLGGVSVCPVVDNNWVAGCVAPWDWASPVSSVCPTPLPSSGVSALWAARIGPFFHSSTFAIVLAQTRVCTAVFRTKMKVFGPEKGPPGKIRYWLP